MFGFEPGDRVKVIDWPEDDEEEIKETLMGREGTVVKPPYNYSHRIRYLDVAIDGLENTRLKDYDTILFKPEEIEKI